MISMSAALRNRALILEVLQQYFDFTIKYKALEIASGSGEHIIHFAQHLPNVTFQPSDINPRYLHSIVAYVDKFKLKNVNIPLHIDAAKPSDTWHLPYDYESGKIDAIININMIHISSNDAVNGLFNAAGSLLRPQHGKLFLYGPFSFDGVIKPESNILFHQSLISQNSEWGLRDVKFLEKIAAENNLSLLKLHEMPANNHVLVFQKG